MKLFAFLTLMLLNTSAQGQTVVDRVIGQQTKNIGGVEYRDGRRVIEADVDGNGTRDIVVLFTIEGLHHGSNDWLQMISVVPRTRQGYGRAVTRQVGGRGFQVSIRKVTRGHIRLATMSLARSDAMCCPSIPGRMTFRYAHHRLIKVRK